MEVYGGLLTAELTMVTASNRGIRTLWSAGISFETC